MIRKSYLLAHDIGTTGSKASLFEAGDGVPVASSTHPYPTRYPHPNWAEQDPDDWRGAVCEGTRVLLEGAAVNPSDVAVVSFSGHMQGMLALDRSGRPLRPAMIWADQRARAEADLIERVVGGPRAYQITGQRVSPAYTAAKLLWIREHSPEIFRRVACVLQAKDYAVYLLTGRIVTDYSDASGTQLFDIVNRRWSDELFEPLGLDARLMPEAVPSTTIVGRVTPEAARLTGLLSGTPVVIGGGDGACASVGAGSVRSGQAYTYIGSSAWVALTTAEPVVDPEQRTFTMAHLDPRLYFSLGAMQAAGGAFDWMGKLLHDEAADRFALMECEASGVPAGSRGLLFLPHLLGERSPYWNPLARGALVGLSLAHGRPEVTRATLEGVAYTLRQIVEALRSQGAVVAQMRLIGGGARSRLWRQILTDVYGMPVFCPVLNAEATALGAAIAGGVGVGLYSGFEVAETLVPAGEKLLPDPANGEEYDALRSLFAGAYRSLEPLFSELAARQG